MEKGLSNTKTPNGTAQAFRGFFKQRSISSTLSMPIRIVPAWSRMLRFGNTAKFRTDEYFEVNRIA